VKPISLQLQKCITNPSKNARPISSCLSYVWCQFCMHVPWCQARIKISNYCAVRALWAWQLSSIIVLPSSRGTSMTGNWRKDYIRSKIERIFCFQGGANLWKDFNFGRIPLKPALLTRISMTPKVVHAFSTAASITLSSLLTSTSTIATLPGLGLLEHSPVSPVLESPSVRALISSHSDSRSRVLRAAMITLHPLSASVTENTLPSPDDAPVISATFPSISSISSPEFPPPFAVVTSITLNLDRLLLSLLLHKVKQTSHSSSNQPYHVQLFCRISVLPQPTEKVTTSFSPLFPFSLSSLFLVALFLESSSSV